MASDESKFQLPETLASSGDPIEGNPFPAGSSRHVEWARATRIAGEKHARAMAAWFEPPSTNTRQWDPFALLVQKFEIWAERGIHVVWSDAEQDAFNAWLVSYANALLEVAAAESTEHPFLARESHVFTLRNRLAGRVHHWSAEARTYRRKQIEGEAQLPPERSEPDVETKPPTEASFTEVIARRAQRIKDYKTAHGLSWKDFERLLGMSETAIRAIVNEDRPRFSEEKRDRLLRKLGLTASDWNSA